MTTDPPDPSAMSRGLTHIRRTFLTGALVAVPVVATYWVLRFLFGVTDGVLRPILEQALGRRIPGLGIIALLVLIYILGLVATNVLGRRAIDVGQQALLRIPLVNTVYGAMKSLAESLFGRPGTASAPRRVVMIEYPGPGLWAIGFLTGTTRREDGQMMAIVYVPTAPTPQTGWAVFVPIERVRETDLTVQEAMQLILSAGVLSPDQIGTKSLDESSAIPRSTPRGPSPP